MVVAIYGKSVNDDFFPYLRKLIACFKERGVELTGEEGFVRFLGERYDYRPGFCGTYGKEGIAGRKAELLLSIGGDGTFLDAVGYVRDSGIPILGVNSGRLGFLANVSAGEIDEAVESICCGRYVTEQREMLHLEVDGEVLPRFDYALNEVSVLKTELSSLLKIHAYIGDVYLTTYWADGLIIATPTGSTAYSLSGGGPIVSPECKNIILTPVCPHNLSMRPLIVPDTARIRLKVDGRSKNFMLCMDSKMQKMEDSHELQITTGNMHVNVVKLANHNYYETLRNKLMWGEDRRNGEPVK